MGQLGLLRRRLCNGDSGSHQSDSRAGGRSKSGAPIDYTMEISNSPQRAPVNTLARFNGTLTGTSCYIYPVNSSCGSGGPPTCRVAPAVPSDGKRYAVHSDGEQ
jgi:hypothetical protein